MVVTFGRIGCIYSIYCNALHISTGIVRDFGYRSSVSPLALHLQQKSARPTRSKAFGMAHSVSHTRSKLCELLFAGIFPDVRVCGEDALAVGRGLCRAGHGGMKRESLERGGRRGCGGS